MTTSYVQMIVICLVALCAPALVLCWKLRPEPFHYILRGSESAVCLAVAVDSLRRLTFIASGQAKVNFPESQWGIPGSMWALWNIVILGFVALLLWVRLSQLLRHDARNREVGRIGVEYLRQQGVPEDRLPRVPQRPWRRSHQRRNNERIH